MRILVWGLGYVGTVSAACFARFEHDVVGIEPNRAKVDAINNGRSAVREPGIDQLIEQAVANGRLRATLDGITDVRDSDVSIVCVGTPSAADGSQILDYVRSVAKDLGKGLRSTDRFHTVVIRSTVLPGTTRSIVQPLLEASSGKKAGEDFGLVMNPEFLREATAIKDFEHPPYTIIGELDERSGDVAAEMYREIDEPTLRVSLEEAEMVKLCNNAFHALKIGFANEIGRISGELGVDASSVMEMVCADTKLNISKAYLRPGFAFGGSCLPKDLRSLTKYAGRAGLDVPILQSILPSNSLHIEAARRKVLETGIKKVGILGLSFKAHTDDLRESPTFELVRSLWQDGLDLTVGDPDVRLDEMLGSNRDYLERQLPQIHQIFRSDLLDVVRESELLVVTHRRPEFSQLIENHSDGMPVLNLS